MPLEKALNEITHLRVVERWTVIPKRARYSDRKINMQLNTKYNYSNLICLRSNT